MLKCSTALPILAAFMWSKKSSDVLTLSFALNIHKCKNVFELMITQGNSQTLMKNNNDFDIDSNYIC